jgi:bacterioferritin-associated ferredoxin
MIVCSCNILSDREIRDVVTASRAQPLSAQQVYDCLGCTIRCGRCARGIKRIITEASMAGAERRCYSAGPQRRLMVSDSMRQHLEAKPI